MSKKKFIVLMISLLLLSLFVFFSYLVAKETFVQFDFDNTVKLQDRIPRKLDYPFSVFSILGLFEITAAVWLIFFFTLIIKRHYLAASAFFSFWFGLALEVYGKIFLFHPSPPYFFFRGMINFEMPKYYVHTDYSYPSGHVYRSAFLVSFLACWLLLGKVSAARVMITLALGGFLLVMIVSRVYLGEHWTTDVIGGTLLGMSFGMLSSVFIRRKY